MPTLSCGGGCQITNAVPDPLRPIDWWTGLDEEVYDKEIDDGQREDPESYGNAELLEAGRADTSFSRPGDRRRHPRNGVVGK